MSYDTERYSMDMPSNRSLCVIECGLQICHSGHSSGRLVYPDYSAHFILEGKGTYSVNGKVYELCAGQGFMITPNIPNIYIADEKEPWKYIYATFKGIDAPALVHSSGLDDENVVFDFPLTQQVISNLKNMHAAGRDYLSKGYDILGYFLLAMSNLVKQNSEKKQCSLTSDRYVRLAMTYMEDRFTGDISVQDAADYVRIDRSHLYRLFKKHLGTSPSEYLMTIRLECAVKLMEYEGLSINEIALSSGFYDLSHFSRMFTSKYGVSPGKYQKMLTAKNSEAAERSLR